MRHVVCVRYISIRNLKLYCYRSASINTATPIPRHSAPFNFIFTFNVLNLHGNLDLPRKNCTLPIHLQLIYRATSYSSVAFSVNWAGLSQGALFQFINVTIMATTANSNIRLLTVLVDCNDEEEGDYRFLVDEKHVKYVTVDPGVFIPKGRSDLCARAHSSAATFPPGNWNEGHISKDPLTQRPVFARVTRSDLPEIRNTWHDRRIDHLELKELDRVRQNIHHVTCPAFDVPVLVKFAEFHWQMPYFKAETTAYEWIEGKGIGPRFLGHLTEDGRVFGIRDGKHRRREDRRDRRIWLPVNASWRSCTRWG